MVNWRGMWAKRFEEKHKKAEKGMADMEQVVEREMIEEDARIRAQELVRGNRDKIMGRLMDLNRLLGLVGLER